ncbi:alanine--tRNA ligase [Candidatus Kuenenbacteria bacterium]|nr:alanine--tRNA ligase [Candidatus Kuenenbacteria bacterium]
MTAKELRQKYIDFFKAKGHTPIPSASLMPENDPSVLFTTAGMHPLVPFLLGEKHPAGARLVNSQKCIRTGDIDEVGDKIHHTFFEMLGHWSLGDYFKEEAIKMSYEFLTNGLGLDKGRLAFTVFAGDDNAPVDEEAASVWRSLGIKKERIVYLPKADNWWEPSGSGGPCGPCTEMFYWSDKETSVPESFEPSDKRWVEIGNDVLMQYEKKGENNYILAHQKNIDNGTGLERNLAILNGFDDNYLIDLFWPIILKIEELSGKKYLIPVLSLEKRGGDEDDTPLSAVADTSPKLGEDVKRSMRIIADHLRAAVMIMGDDLGIAPSNVDQGYVVRKLIRRAIRHGRMIDIQENFTDKIAAVVIEIMGEAYPELERNRKFIMDNLVAEEEKFGKTLQEGLKVFHESIKTLKHESKNAVDGKSAFDLYQSYGFPLELTKELAKENGLEVDEVGFEEEFKKHQELSRTAAAGKFKGGLADHSEKVTAYHTATHLLNAALRQVLGEHVFQKGSNITEERLRFDFSHPEKMTAEQIKQVEDLVNEIIQKNVAVECAEMTAEEAKVRGAIGVFADKYGEKVKVYSVGGGDICFSKEICGGPHVERTGGMGHFRIIKEEASSAGVRRIKAVLE